MHQQIQETGVGGTQHRGRYRGTLTVSIAFSVPLRLSPTLVWAGQQAWGHTPRIFSADSPTAARRCVSKGRKGGTILHGAHNPQDFS